jgi:DNA-binding CsgD family transcriptional regulator/PAS domain-containing protein
VLSIDEHSEIVSRLYASAMGETPWTSTLALLADRFGTSGSVLHVSRSGGFTDNPFVENHGYSREFAEKYYASDVFANDPRSAYFANVKPGSIYFDHGLYDVEEMRRDPRCRASFEVLKVEYQLGAGLKLPNQSNGILSLLSTAKEGHATEEAIASFRRLAPHMEQACALGHVMEGHAAKQNILLEALAGKADGVIMLNRSGVPIFVNDSAQSILAAGDGLAFSGEEFSAQRGPETRRLRAMIHDATAAASGLYAHPGGQMLVTRLSGKRPFVLRVMPAPRMERFLTGNNIACVIHLHDLALVQLPSKQTLCSVFGLSEREADLAIELARCTNLTSAAANAGMALNTARNHLQSIFRKSGTANQAEVVQLFSRLL